MSGANGAGSSLRAFTDDYRNAWNTHDAAVLTGFFEQDADMIFGNLPAVRGRQAIRQWWSTYFAGLEPQRRLTLDVNVRSVARDVGLVELVTTTGGSDGRGGTLPARRFRATWAVRRRTGKWRIAALRGFPTEADQVVLRPSADPASALGNRTARGSPELRELVEAYAAAFNRHDPSAVTAFYTDDADIVVRNGPYTRGRQTIEAWWRTYFAEPRPYVAMFVIDSVRTMTPDVALIDLVATGTAQTAEVWTQSAGQTPSMPRDTRYARATWVLVHGARKWRIAALRVLPSLDDQVIRAGSP